MLRYLQPIFLRRAGYLVKKWEKCYINPPSLPPPPKKNKLINKTDVSSVSTLIHLLKVSGVGELNATQLIKLNCGKTGKK